MTEATESKTMAEAKDLVMEVLSQSGTVTKLQWVHQVPVVVPWKDNIDAGWSYLTLRWKNASLEIGASEGGVVSLDGDPFPPDRFSFPSSAARSAVVPNTTVASLTSSLSAKMRVLLPIIATSEEFSDRVYAALHPDTPDNVLFGLLGNEDAVAEPLLTRKNMSEALLLKALNVGVFSARHRAALHPDATEAVMLKALDVVPPTTALEMLKGGRVTFNVLIKAMQMPDVAIQNLAASLATPDQVKAAFDQTLSLSKVPPVVFRLIAYYPQPSKDLMLKVVNFADEHTYLALANFVGTPPEVLDTLLDKANFQIRVAAVQNPSISPESLRKGLEDPVFNVVEAAKRVAKSFEKIKPKERGSCFEM